MNILPARWAIACAALFAASAAAAEPGTLPCCGDLHWRQLGPFRGGWATMVDGVPSRPDTFFFGAAGGGLWRTDNAGRTWTPLFQHGPAASIGAVAVAPSAPNTVYLGTGQPEPRYDIAAGLGVFKSTDGGATWSNLGLANTRYIGRIWVDPRDANTVLVGAQGHFFGPSPDRGIYRSIDGGKNWVQALKLDDRTGVVDIAADPQNPNLLFAAAWQAQQYPWQSYFTPVTGPGSAIYKSTDGGAHWTRLAGGGWPTAPLGRISLAVAHLATGTRVYAAVDADEADKAAGLYRSDDAGGTWTRVNDGEAFTSYYASRLTVAPNDPDVIYTVGQSIRRCIHGGADCTIIKGAPGGDDYHHIWINPAHPDHMITGSDQGATVSVDGGASWSSWYNQPTGQFYHLAADNRFPYWIYSGQQDSGTVGIASRSDYGAPNFRDWHPVGGDERDYDIPDPADPLIVYGSGLGGRVSKWDGRTGQVQNIAPWPVSSYGKRPTTTKYHYLWVTPLVASRTGPAALYLGSQVVFRSTDRGLHWSTISGDLTGKVAGAQRCGGNVALADAKPCGYGSIATIAPSPRHAGEIWVGTDDGLIQVTRDGGAHWADVTPAGVPVWAKVASLEVSPLKDGTAYAVIDGQRLDDFQPHILRTIDGGKNWQPIVNGLPDDHFATVVRADPGRAGLLYAGTDAGMFVSLDDGGHWQRLQQNLPTAWVRDLLVHGDDLIAATQGRAIWVLDDLTPLRQLSPSLAHAPAALFTPAVALRVHPNMNTDTPLPPETPVGENPPAGAVIDYWIGPHPSGPVTLDILDAAGKTVRHFSSADRPAPVAAERYFEKGWLRPAAVLSAEPGLHRFLWDLHYPRPAAISCDYSIAAIWGQNTPALPLGAFVLPGTYRVVLTVDGTPYTAPLTVREDPRISTSAADLRASLALSQRISAGLTRAWIGYGEMRAVRRQLDADGTGAAVSAAKAELDRAGTLEAPTFEQISGILGAIESDLEGADVAPTAAQVHVMNEISGKLDAAWARWTAMVPTLNAELGKAGLNAVTVPAVADLHPDAPDPGQDLP